MDDLSNELLSFIFDFIPEDSLELRKVCDDWDFVVTKYYNKNHIRSVCALREIVEIFYRSKLNVHGTDFLDYIRYIHKFNLWGAVDLRDFSALSNIHTLDLTFTGVEDVSSLSNVHTLDLRYTKVEDVSSLGNVHTLNLLETRVKDVSNLSNVNITGMSYLYTYSLDDLSVLSRMRRKRYICYLEQ